MKTPIIDFVQKYKKEDQMRLHMPGHKGNGFLGVESLDITEIEGADSLYEASGIIAESEKNASELFACPTYYSTEGSSQCIRAMLYLAMMHAKQNGKKPIVWAGRNAHKAFCSACALLDVELEWIYSDAEQSYLSCDISAEHLNELINCAMEKPTAVYITSPDYLGNIADISGIARVCHENGVLLLVDNAHGAYLSFLSPSLHPMELGADICCDSAHKTLPVLTGGAYLHLSHEVNGELSRYVKDAMALFGSTSPSYLILQSLDAANEYLASHKSRLSAFCPKIDELKSALRNGGYALYGNEPLKITVCAKKYGYLGVELAKILLEKGVVCEFSDPDFLVMMFTPEITDADIERLKTVMLEIPKRQEITENAPEFHKTQRVMRIREAMLSPCEMVLASDAENRVLASSSEGCPPAVPIVVSGELIDKNSISAFKYYGIEKIKVIK